MPEEPLLKHAKDTVRIMNSGTSRGRYLKKWEKKLYHSALTALGFAEEDLKRAQNSFWNDKCEACKDIVVRFYSGDRRSTESVGACIGCGARGPIKAVR